MNNHSAADQRTRILNYLQKHGSATTIELRHNLDIMQPAARIFELKHHFGHNIVTTLTEAENPEGGTQKVARYTLKAGKYRQVA